VYQKNTTMKNWFNLVKNDENINIMDILSQKPPDLINSKKRITNSWSNKS